MKVSELKALFQKNGTGQNASSNRSKPVQKSFHQIQPHLSQNVYETLPKKYYQKSEKQIKKGNSLVKQLSKRLPEQQKSQQKIQVIRFSKNKDELTCGQGQNTQNIEQLNFTNILKDIIKTQIVISSQRLARMGIDKNHPINKRQENMMFASQQIQRQSSMQQLALKHHSSQYLEESSPNLELNNFYKRMNRDNKIQRVNRIIDCIFKVKQSQIQKNGPYNIQTEAKDTALISKLQQSKSQIKKTRRKIFTPINSKNDQESSAKKDKN